MAGGHECSMITMFLACSPVLLSDWRILLGSRPARHHQQFVFLGLRADASRRWYAGDEIRRQVGAGRWTDSLHRVHVPVAGSRTHQSLRAHGGTVLQRRRLGNTRILNAACSFEWDYVYMYIEHFWCETYHFVI